MNYIVTLTMTAQQLDVLKNSGIEFIDMFYEADDGESIGESMEGDSGGSSEDDSEGSVHTSDEEFIDDD
jgi:hypothetical protein